MIRLFVSVLWCCLFLQVFGSVFGLVPSSGGHCFGAQKELPRYCRFSTSSPDYRVDNRIREKVRKLVNELDAPTRNQRDRAQQMLELLGPGILPHLSAMSSGSLEQKRRLVQICQALYVRRAHGTQYARRLTVKASETSLQKVLYSVVAQTGNDMVEVHKFFRSPRGKHTFNVDWNDMTFWQAITTLTTQQGWHLVLDADHKILAFNSAQSDQKAVFLQQNSPFCVLAGSINLKEGVSEDIYELPVEVLWEPRIRPLFWTYEMKDVLGMLDEEKEVLPFDSEAAYEVLPREGQIGLKQVLQLKLDGKESAQIKEIRGKLTAAIPSVSEPFSFPNPADLKSRRYYRKAGLSVELEHFRRDLSRIHGKFLLYFDDLHSVRLESYQRARWFGCHEVYIRSSHDPGAVYRGVLKFVGNDPQTIEVSYEFSGIPDSFVGNELIYCAPPMILEVVVHYVFSSLPLP